MIIMTVADFKAKFSEVVALVDEGKEIAVTYGRSKKIVGYFTKNSQTTKKYPIQRTLGVFADGSFEMESDYKMSPEELGMTDELLD